MRMKRRGRHDELDTRASKWSCCAIHRYYVTRYVPSHWPCEGGEGPELALHPVKSLRYQVCEEYHSIKLQRKRQKTHLHDWTGIYFEWSAELRLCQAMWKPSGYVEWPGRKRCVLRRNPWRTKSWITRPGNRKDGDWCRSCEPLSCISKQDRSHWIFYMERVLIERGRDWTSMVTIARQRRKTEVYGNDREM